MKRREVRQNARSATSACSRYLSPASGFLLISSTGALSFRLLLDRLRARSLFVDIQVKFVLKRPKGSLQAIEPGCMIKPEQAIDLFAVPAESTRKLSLRRVALA